MNQDDRSTPMPSPNEEGALFAALLGDLDDNTHTEIQQMLAQDPELQRELDALEALDTFLHQTIGGLGVPDPQDLVDVVAGQATDQQKLIVAAYVRNSVRGRREMDELEAELPVSEAPVSSAKIGWRLPSFIAQPLQAGAGLRSSGLQSVNQSFQVVDVNAMVTLRIAPPVAEEWKIEGYATQNHLPVAHAAVVLEADGIEIAHQPTDTEGFFTFPALTEGNYKLFVHLENSIVVMDKIELQDDELF